MAVLEEVCRKGVSVNIKRSNGRVHAAIISGFDGDNRTVTVEWVEQGETKGKTIDLDVILQLNPDIKSQADSASGSGGGRSVGGGTGDSVLTVANQDAGTSSKSGVAQPRSAVVQHGDHALLDTTAMANGNPQLVADSSMPPPSAAGRPTAVGRKRPVGATGSAVGGSGTNIASLNNNDSALRRETRAMGQSTTDANGQ